MCTKSSGVKKTLFVFFQEKYIEVASELIVYTYFFSASEDVLPEVSCYHSLLLLQKWLFSPHLYNFAVLMAQRWLLRVCLAFIDM